MSYFKTALLIAAMTALFMGIGAIFGGRGGIMIAFLIAVAMNGFAYWNSDKMVLKMHNAKQVDAHSAPNLVNLVQQLAVSAQLPMPKVYIIDQKQPNAFATGRNPENAAVAATTGLLNMLSHDEIKGVMAHELAHIKNRDTIIMTITATLAGAISMIANWLQFSMLFGGSDNRNNPFGIIGMLATIILAPLAALLVQMAISRTREYQADKMGAIIAGETYGLASALTKIDHFAKNIRMESAERGKATAHLFIINPLSRKGVDNLFATHPSTQNRIDALAALNEELEFQPASKESVNRGMPKEEIIDNEDSVSTNPWQKSAVKPSRIPKVKR